MPNPLNTCIVTGMVINSPAFSKTKAGDEFGCRFTLSVKRNYKNNGEYKSDLIPVRYEGINRMGFAHNYVQKGMRLSIIGSWKTEPFKVKNETVYSNFLLAESIQLAPINRETEPSSAELPI